ncbi:uncharacterized protein VTP21DRAFT_129 [Calcarisporiella thermophila]|uniref:uncharacterized protein n=1 Tax=Calcarisporiella thermophila TaxID=911321 RepID=UPI003743F034
MSTRSFVNFCCRSCYPRYPPRPTRTSYFPLYLSKSNTSTLSSTSKSQALALAPAHSKPSRSVRHAWTPNEDELIRQFVATHGPKWARLHRELLPHRNPNSILTRWYEVLDPSLKRGPITRTEAEKLRAGVEKYGNQWALITRELPGRTSKWCANMWKYVIDPNVSKRQPWSEKEDEILLEGVKKYGRKWVEIVKLLPGRTQLQAKTRYDQVLRVNRTPWTPEERDILLRRVLMYGPRWDIVAEGLEGRTAPQCKTYWEVSVDPTLLRNSSNPQKIEGGEAVAAPEPDLGEEDEDQLDVEGGGSQMDGPLEGQEAPDSERSTGYNWTLQEELLFWDQVKKHGPQWTKVALALPGRSRIDCFYKYRNTAERMLGNVPRDGPTQAYSEKQAIELANMMSELLRKCLNAEKSDDADPQDSLVNLLSLRKIGRWTEEESRRLMKAVAAELEMKDNKSNSIDWMKVSMSIPGRSPLQCRLRYQYMQIKERETNAPWTADDDAALLNAVETYGRRWTRIATALSRTATQCANRYSALKRDARGGHLSEEEKERLSLLVDIHGTDWITVAKHLPGRTPAQCSYTWNNWVRPGIRNGPWTPAEDEQLRLAVEQLGTRAWSQVALLMPGRNRYQCRQRWEESLAPGIKKGPWTNEEEMRLIEAVVKHGMKWQRIREEVPGRSARMCRWKYMMIMKLKNSSDNKDSAIGEGKGLSRLLLEAAWRADEKSMADSETPTLKEERFD